MTKGFIERAYDEGTLKGREEGRNEGVHEGQVRFLRAMIERKFGSLPEPFVDRLNHLPADKLVNVGMKVMTAESLDELGVE